LTDICKQFITPTNVSLVDSGGEMFVLYTAKTDIDPEVKGVRISGG